MIRYKKHRILQQGGTSPAAGLSAGAAATAAVGSATPYRIAAPQKLEMPGDKDGTGARGRKGSTRPGKAAGGKYVNSTHVPNMAKFYNDELEELQKTYNAKIAADPEYGTSKAGMDELSSYRKVYSEYTTTIRNLDSIYAKAIQTGEDAVRQKAILDDGTVFVMDPDTHKVATITYDDFLQDKAKGDQRKYVEGALTLGDLMTLLDDPQQYDQGDNPNKYAKMIPKIIDNSPKITSLLQGVKTLAQTNKVINIDGGGMEFIDGAVLTPEDVKYYNGAIDTEDGTTEAGSKYITEIVEANLNQFPGLRSYIMQSVADDTLILAQLTSDPTERAELTEQAINAHTWELIKPYYKKKDATVEEVEGTADALRDLQRAAGKDPYYQATTNWTDGDTPSRFDQILVEYNQDGEVKKPGQTENSFRTVKVDVGTSINDISKDIETAAGVSDKKFQEESTLNLSLSMIPTIATRGDVRRAQLADGTQASAIKHSGAHVRDHIPIIGRPMSFTQLPTMNGKIAIWIVDILKDVGDAQAKIIDESIEKFNKTKSATALPDDAVTEKAKQDFVAKRMTEEYQKILIKRSGPENQMEGLPGSYEDFLKLEVKMGNFWAVDVVSEVDYDEAPESAKRFMRKVDESTGGGAGATITKYVMDEEDGDFYETKVFIPVVMNTAVDFGKGAGLMAELNSKANERKIDLSSLVPENRDLFSLLNID